VTEPDAPVRYSDDANVEPEECEPVALEARPAPKAPVANAPKEAGDESVPEVGTYYTIEFVAEDPREGFTRLMDALDRLGCKPRPLQPDEPFAPFVEVPGTGYKANLRDGTYSAFCRIQASKKLPPGN
jgi:hypothetical protein